MQVSANEWNVSQSEQKNSVNDDYVYTYMKAWILGGKSKTVDIYIYIYTCMHEYISVYAKIMSLKIPLIPLLTKLQNVGEFPFHQ